jgi:broad-specificity NMP kinase
MYKQFRIISSEALGKEIDEIFEELGIKEYFIADWKSSWGENLKHMNNHIWPGMDEIRIVVVSKCDYEILYKRLKDFKSKIKDALKLRIIITTIDEII